jgi:hypothetical protein
MLKLRVTNELTVPLDPAIAQVLRAKASLPHQLNPPSTWGALGYLAAVSLGPRMWFSDGRTLWSAAGELRLDAHPEVARIIAAHPFPVGEPVQAVPRAFPLGALPDGRMIWVLRWYGADHRYVCAPIVLDAASGVIETIDVRNTIDGTAPKRLLATADPDVYLITGEVDAGAAAHIDDFIMVPVAWEVNVARRTCAWLDRPNQGRSTSGLVAASTSQALTAAGLSYTTHALRFERRGAELVATLDGGTIVLDDLPSLHPYDDRGDRWVSTTRDGGGILLLDLRRCDRARVCRFEP